MNVFFPQKAWGKSIREGVVYMVLVLVISFALGMFIEPDPLTTIRRYPFKSMFVIGMAISVFAQTAVEAFLEKNNLLDCCNMPAEDEIKKYSNFVLAVFAMVSIMFLGNSWVHIPATLLYILIVLGLDIFVLRSAKGSSKEAILCRNICQSMALKVDGNSLISLLIIWVVSHLLSSQYIIRNVIADIQRVSASLGNEADPSVIHVLEQDLGRLEALAGGMPDILVSGAIGFHLLMTAGLIGVLMWEWNKVVKTW
jgi:hypothetical protein